MVLLGSDRVQPIVGKCLSDSPGSRTQAESFQEGANQAQFALWSFTLSKIELLKAHLRDGGSRGFSRQHAGAVAQTAHPINACIAVLIELWVAGIASHALAQTAPRTRPDPLPDAIVTI